jgi:hypothetical protein
VGSGRDGDVNEAIAQKIPRAAEGRASFVSRAAWQCPRCSFCDCIHDNILFRLENKVAPLGNCDYTLVVNRCPYFGLAGTEAAFAIADARSTKNGKPLDARQGDIAAI